MRHFFAHVAGESHRNDDGSDRQAIIARCRVGEPLLLIPESDNPHDENAIRVLREDGKQIGYLERGLAARFTGEGFDDCHAFVAGTGRAGGSYYGVALLIVVAQERDEEPEVSAYAGRVLEQEGNLAAGGPRRRRPRKSVEGPAASSIMRPIIIGAIVAAGFIVAVAMFAKP